MLTSAPAPQPHPEGGRCHFPVSIWAGSGRAGSCFRPPASLWRLLDKAARTSPLPLAHPPARPLWTLCFPVPPLCSASSEPRLLGGFPELRQGPQVSLVCSPVPSHRGVPPHRGVPSPSPPPGPAVFSPSSLSSRPLPGLGNGVERP